MLQCILTVMVVFAVQWKVQKPASRYHKRGVWIAVLGRPDSLHLYLPLSVEHCSHSRQALVLPPLPPCQICCLDASSFLAVQVHSKENLCLSK